MKIKQLHLLLVSLSAAGYGWLLYVMNVPDAKGFCLINNLCGIPCPSCGITRSIIFLIHGDFQKALFTNALGIIVAVVMLLIPVCLFFDLVFGRRTFLRMYTMGEAILKRPVVAVSLLLLVGSNWVWSILR